MHIVTSLYQQVKLRMKKWCYNALAKNVLGENWSKASTDWHMYIYIFRAVNLFELGLINGPFPTGKPPPQNSQFTTKNVDNFPIERDSVPVLKRCCDSPDIVTGCMGDILMDQDQTRGAWISNQVLYNLSFWCQYSNQSDHHNTLCNLTVTIYNVNQIF